LTGVQPRPRSVTQAQRQPSGFRARPHGLQFGGSSLGWLKMVSLRTAQKEEASSVDA